MAEAPTDPYLAVTWRDGAATARGQAEATLGYRLPWPEGERDAGDWVHWRWDGRQLTLQNDRLGAYPVYYADSGDGIAISPSIDRLLELGVSTELDVHALAVFLSVGYYVGQDTAFSAIRALPPAATLTWVGGEVSLQSRPPRFPTIPTSRARAIEEGIERARVAVRRCLPADDAPYLMPVSGGRDSRHILLELVRAGRPPTAGLTVEQYPTDWGGDAPFGAALCRAQGIAHRTLEPGSLIAAEWRKNRLTDYAADEHAWYLPLVDALRGSGGHTYDGLGGGLLLHREFMTRAVRRAWHARSWDELAAASGKKDERGAPRYDALVAPHLRSVLGAEVGAARIRRELGRHLDADDPYLSFTIFNRTVREVSVVPMRMLAGATTAYTPFTDPEFFAFAASIPDELAGTDLHSELIARAFRKAAGLPYAPKRPPAPDRGFLRRTARELTSLLWHHSDGSLVDRRALLRRAARTALTGDGWFAWGRRAALTTYLVQLEVIVRGERMDPFAWRTPTPVPPEAGPSAVSSTRAV